MRREINQLDDERTTAIGLARYAREYFDSALAADKVVGQRKGYEITAPAPVMHLVAHSIELVLKSYLRHSGMSVKDIKDFGHDLKKCLDEALRHDLDQYLELSSEEVATISLIGDLHKSTELKYIKTGYRTLPVFGPLQTVTRKLLDVICPLVGYR